MTSSALDALNYFGESNFEVDDTPPPPVPVVYTPMKPEDDLGFPPTLPVELALKTAPIEEICAAYGLSTDEFLDLATQPAFAAAYKEAQELVKEEGMAFKLKAKMQAEAMLQTSWSIVHDPETPSSVRADLIKSTVRWAGYEPKTNPEAATNGGAGSGINIQINLG